MTQTKAEQIKRGKELIEKFRAIGIDSKLLEERVTALELKLKEHRKEGPKQTANYIISLEQILGLRLSELTKRNIALRVNSEVLGSEIWLCGNQEMAAKVRQDDPRAVVYTADKLRKLYNLQPSPDGLRAIHNVKIVFNESRVDSRLKEDDDIPF